jgi:hypothetical protein
MQLPQVSHVIQTCQNTTYNIDDTTDLLALLQIKSTNFSHEHTFVDREQALIRKAVYMFAVEMLTTLRLRILLMFIIKYSMVHHNLYIVIVNHRVILTTQEERMGCILHTDM